MVKIKGKTRIKRKEQTGKAKNKARKLNTGQKKTFKTKAKAMYL